MTLREELEQRWDEFQKANAIERGEELVSFGKIHALFMEYIDYSLPVTRTALGRILSKKKFHRCYRPSRAGALVALNRSLP